MLKVIVLGDLGLRPFVDAVINGNAVLSVGGEEIDQGDAANTPMLVTTPVIVDEFIVRRPALIKHGIVDDEVAVTSCLRAHFVPEIMRPVGAGGEPARN